MLFPQNKRMRRSLRRSSDQLYITQKGIAVRCEDLIHGHDLVVTVAVS